MDCILTAIESDDYVTVPEPPSLRDVRVFVAAHQLRDPDDDSAILQVSAWMAFQIEGARALSVLMRAGSPLANALVARLDDELAIVDRDDQ